MNRLLSFVFLLLTVTTLSAQNEKFGKPSKEEWDLTSVSFAPDADAVVLYKSVNLTYNLSGAFSALGSGGEGSLDDNQYAASGTNKYVSPEGATQTYDVKLRTKILKDSGAPYTSLDILIYNEKDDMNSRDDFYDMKITVFSNVDGKIKKKRIAGANIKDERIDDHYCIRHVRIPDVKAGDIVEYQYQLFSSRITYIYDTQLQENIPVLYSKCQMEVPFFLQFTVNKPEIPNVIASVERGNILMKSPSNDMSLPRKCATNVYKIEARNLSPYDGVIDLQNLSSGKVYGVRTVLSDSRYDVKPDASGPIRHLIIGK